MCGIYVRHTCEHLYPPPALAEFIAEDALLTRGKINRCGEVLAGIVNVHRAVDGIPAVLHLCAQYCSYVPPPVLEKPELQYSLPLLRKVFLFL